MADTVRLFMEEMVPELEDLEEKGHFSRQELREVLKRREHFEYALKRRPPLKGDFLRYIEYETGLAELLQLRCAANGVDPKDGRGVISITKRCHKLYDRATRRFKGDLELWQGWLEFCKASGSTQRVTRVLAAALQLHPKAAGLWVHAANWEFEHNRSAGRARRLMQQALRACKNDEQLWLEYFRMELLFACKLQLRHRVLGVRNPDEERKELTEALAGAKADVDASEDGFAALQQVLSGGVAMLVMREAVTRRPTDVSFRRKLLELSQEGGLSAGRGFPAITREILDGLEVDFHDDEEAWALRARHTACGNAAGTSSRGVSEAPFQIFEDALRSVPTSKMFDEYLAFLLEQMDDDGPQDSSQREPKARQKKLAKRALDLCKRAGDEGLLSEATALEWPQLALRCGRVSQALEAAKAGTDAHSTCPQLWQQRITLVSQAAHLKGQNGCQDEAGEVSLREVVTMAARCVEKSEAAAVWKLGLRAYQQLSLSVDSLLDAMQLVLAASRPAPVDSDMGTAAAEAVAIVLEEQGIEAARKQYRALLKLPPCGVALFHKILDIELAQPAPSLPQKKLAAIFEAAVATYGREDTKLWMRYAAFDLSQGRGAGNVYWKAVKTLENPDAFIAQQPE